MSEVAKKYSNQIIKKLKNDVVCCLLYCQFCKNRVLFYPIGHDVDKKI